MALRARLVAPQPKPRQVWPWHIPEVASIPALVLFSGERRMEAEMYLSSGYGLRTAIEGKPNGWTRFGKQAKIWKPGRAKGILMSKQFGTPFLAATQVFDARPIARKWVSIEHTKDAALCLAKRRQIVVTCSGSVGRATILTAAHDQNIISNDLLRIEPQQEGLWGWLYAYLQAPQVRLMTRGMQYGHIIKHLETSHLEALPIPLVNNDTLSDFDAGVSRIFELRNESHSLTLEAEARFEKAIGALKITDWGEQGFSVRASKAFLCGRRRFDASVHNPAIATIRSHLTKNGAGFTTITSAGYDVWLPKRFRRIPAADGVWLVDSADLAEVNPDLSKRIADGDFGDASKGRVEAGWLLMARSGQTYGIIGTTILAGNDLEEYVISDHVMRIRPRNNCKIKPGYLVTALSHPFFGRPIVKSLAYGSSIPELEVADVANLEVVRLKPTDESIIADLAEASAKARAEADILEREIAHDASAIIDRFITIPK